MIEQERKSFFDEIVSILGTTEIFTAAGYILPDGSLLNLANEDICPDTTVRAYTHSDLKTFFGIDNNEILINGGIRIGFCEINNIPYAQIFLMEFQPTTEQWDKLDELLNLSSGTIDLEMDITPDVWGTGFYKRYTIKDTIKNMKKDMIDYINGDKTNIGHFNEGLGEKDL